MKTDLFYIHLFNDFSGSPRVLRDAIEACASFECTNYVLTSAHSGFLDDLNAKRINIFYLRSKYKYLQLVYYAISQIHLFLILSFWLLKSFFSGNKRAVIVNTLLPFAAGISGKLFANTVLYYVHETSISPRILKLFLHKVINFCSDKVVFVSKFLSDDCSLSVPSQDVIYNGLRRDFKSPNVIAFDEKHKLKQVIFAGSLKAYKGIEQLILLARYTPSIKFIAALNCDEIDLNDFVALRNIPLNLKIFSRPKNLEYLYQQSFIVLNLSLPDQWVETFGLSLIEGMAYGCVPVSPEVGGPIEFVTPSNGINIDARNIAAISTFLINMEKDFLLWRSNAENALLTANCFSSDVYRDDIRKYFINII